MSPLVLVLACAEQAPTPERGSPTLEGARLGAVAAWETPQALRATAVAWADRDLDGDLDLAVGFGDGSPAEVWDSNGGALAPAWVGSPSEIVAWGDKDGDGDPDLATFGQVYENAAGGLVPWSSLPAPEDDVDLAWGDVDGDGDLDLARANAGAHVSVLANGGLALAPLWSAPRGPGYAVDVDWGDVDGDGDLDLVEGLSGAATTIWRNDGSGFVRSWTDPGSVSTEAVAFGDYDADGDPDLAIAGFYRSSTRVFRNDNGVMVLAWTGPVSPRTEGLAWGDWDGDGDLDLASANDQLPVQVHTWTGATFSLAWSAPVGEGSRDVAWGDWDGDGDLDLAVANEGAPLRIYANATVGARLVALPPSPGTAGSTTTVRVVGATPGAAVELYVAAATGAVPAPRCPNLQLGLARANRVGRVVADASGQATFVGSVPTSALGRTGHLQVLEPGACEAGPVVGFTVPDLFRAEDLALATWDGLVAAAGAAVAGLGDQDADGVPEVLVGDDNAGEVHAFAANGGLVDPATAITLTGEAPADQAGHALAARDVDGDGVVEVLVGAPFNDRGGDASGAAYLLTGPLASGPLAGGTAVLVGQRAGDLAGAAVGLSTDLDGDGRWDVLVGAHGHDGGRGAIYLLDGAGLAGPVDLSTAAAEVVGQVIDWDYNGPIGEGLGEAFVVGDANGDGVDDLLASGVATYLFYGPITGVVSTRAADRTWDEPAPSFAVGDLDGDGDPDLAMGLPSCNGGVGCVRVLDGMSQSGALAQRAWATVGGEAAWGRFGTSVVVEDLDGDGTADLVVGSPGAWNSSGVDQAGRVEVFFGPLTPGLVGSSTADLTFEGGAEGLVGDDLGRSLAVAGDANGDGRLDLVVGGPETGTARVLPTF